MKKHIIWLIIALIVLGLCVCGLNSLDGKINMPLLKNEQTNDSAEKVDALIGKISNPVTLKDKEAIETARSAYDALSAEDKAKVTKLPELEAAQAALLKLEAQEGIAQKANAVDGLIAKINNPVTLKDENAIKEARNAYNALSDEEKAKVTKLSVLEDAERALAALKGQNSETYANGDIVTFTGGNVYVSPTETNVGSVIDHESTCTVTIVAEEGSHRYHLISNDGGGVYGWVDTENIKMGVK